MGEGYRGTLLIKKEKKLPPGTPSGPRHSPNVRSYGKAFYNERGTPVHKRGEASVGFGFLISDLWFLVSDLWFLVSAFLFLVSGFLFLVSIFWLLASSLWLVASGFRFLGSGCWFLVSGFWFGVQSQTAARNERAACNVHSSTFMVEGVQGGREGAQRAGAEREGGVLDARDGALQTGYGRWLPPYGTAYRRALRTRFS